MPTRVSSALAVAHHVPRIRLFLRRTIEVVTVILTHRLYLEIGDADRAIDIVVRKPEPEPSGKAWTCRYEVDWPEGSKARDAYGLEALQALVLALEMIGAEILCQRLSPRRQTTRL